MVQADVYIKNLLADNIEISRHFPDGTINLNTVLAGGEEDRFYLPDSDTYLTIRAAGGGGIDVRDWPFTVKSDVDFLLRYSRVDSTWTFKLEPYELSLETPTTVIIIIGPLTTNSIND